jgi:hypothetical protein
MSDLIRISTSPILPALLPVKSWRLINVIFTTLLPQHSYPTLPIPVLLFSLSPLPTTSAIHSFMITEGDLSALDIVCPRVHLMMVLQCPSAGRGVNRRGESGLDDETIFVPRIRASTVCSSSSCLPADSRDLACSFCPRPFAFRSG